MSAVRRTRPPRDLVYLPLGGSGEIGMNCYLYGLGDDSRRQWLMVDLGVKFGDERLPGVDVVLPDLAFAESERRNLLGLLITHAHEDHIGAVPWLWPRLRCPIYCTPFAWELLKNKLAEHSLLEEANVNVVPLGARFPIGPFDIEYVSVTHSLPEPNAVVLRTPLGTVVHSGDWKIDRAPTIPPQMNEARLRAIGEEGVRALVCDSTNVVRDGYSPSESEVEATLAEIVARAPRRVAITTFASHVGRVTSAVRAARRAGREVVLAGRAMRNVVEAARSVGLLADAGQFLDEDALGFLPPERVLLLCTGSQGEPRAAMARIAEDTHPNISLEAGDLAIFSSRTIPGNEKAVSAVMNALARRGIGIVGSEDALIHTSGHPRRGELREMYEWVKPQILVPNHGEPRHLRMQQEFARDCGISEALYVENGQMVRLAPGPAGIVDEAPAGSLHVDGRLIVPSADGPVKFRRKLSFVGIVFVSLLLDDRGDVTDDPQLVLDGLPTETGDGESMSERLLDALDRTLDSMPRGRRRDDNAVTETVRNALRREADALWGKRPIVHVAIHRA